jgi:hypothetical protein
VSEDRLVIFSVGIDLICPRVQSAMSTQDPTPIGRRR